MHVYHILTLAHTEKGAEHDIAARMACGGGGLLCFEVGIEQLNPYCGVAKLIVYVLAEDCRGFTDVYDLRAHLTNFWWACCREHIQSRSTGILAKVGAKGMRGF